MNRHLTPILSSNDNTKAFLPTRKEITEDFKSELRKEVYAHITSGNLRTVTNTKKSYTDSTDELCDKILDLIIDFNPTQTYKSRNR